MKKMIALLLAVLMLMGIMAGCASQKPEPEPEGSAAEEAAAESDAPKMLRIASAFDFKNTMESRSLVFESLITSDMAGNFSGWLAETYDISDDGLTYTFHLKKGVKFHDGSDFNAETVKMCLDFYIETTALGNYAKEVNVLDDYTVELVLNTFTNDILYWLSSTSYPMFCEADIDSEGNRTGFIGTGAFMLDEDSYEKGVSATCYRFDDYWRGAPKLDGVILYVIPDPNAMVVALRSDEVDVIGIAEHHSSVPYVQVKSLMDEGYTVQTDDTGRYQVIEFNTQKAPFDDARVRMAFNLGFDRDTMVNTLFEGVTYSAETIVPQWFSYGPKTVDEHYYGYDFDRAASLLDEAGWKDTDGDGIRDKNGEPFKAKLVVPNGEANADAVAVYLQSELKKLGVDMEVLNLESSAASELQKAGDFDMYVHHSGNMPNTPVISTSGKYYSTSSWTYSFHSPELDAMIDKAFTTFDEASRTEQINAIWEYLHPQAPCLTLYSVLKLTAMNPRVTGYHVGSNMFDMSMVADMDMDMSK